MLRKLYNLAPPFMRTLDKQLLLNFPALWATRIHYLIFTLSLGGILILLRGLLPMDLTNPPDLEVEFFIAIIPVSIVFLLWARYAGLHKVGQQFGQYSFLTQIGVQCIMGIGILLLAAMPFLHTNVTNSKIASTVDDAILVGDINTLNMGEMYFPLPDGDYRRLPYVVYSIKHMKGVMANEELIMHYKNIRHDETAQILLIESYKKVFKKYSQYEIPYSAKEILQAYHTRGKELTISIDEKVLSNALKNANTSLTAIAEAKYKRFFFQEKGVYHVSAFLAFFAWLGMMIFLHIGLKQFLISFVLGITGMMFFSSAISLFGMVSHIDPKMTFFLSFFGVTGFLGLQAFITSKTQRSRFWQRIGLSIATLLLPFTVMALSPLRETIISTNDAMYGGILITLIIWYTLFNQRFIKLKAAPSTD